MYKKIAGLMTTALAISLTSCGTDDPAMVSDTPRLSQAPDTSERAHKAFDSEADFLDFADGLRVYGTSEESRYLSYRAEYDRLWAGVELRAQRVGTVDWYVDAVLRNRARYEAIERSTGVPWFWIGITHGLEASFNFGAHLHNGDPLTARTVNVPARRPLTGTAPFSWETSAIDAITMKGYHTWKDWHLPSMLAYAWERYNGFGYRNKGIVTPYLWSFTTNYTGGKYTSDGIYDPNAVSGQAGAMAVLRRGLDRGVFALRSADPGAHLPDIVSADSKPALHRALQAGAASGRDVLLLEMRLKSFGLFVGMPDRIFDSTTADAVRAAQRQLGLVVDGAVGPTTWARLWPALADAGWMKAWRTGDAVDLRAMAGERCLFKVVSREVPALLVFLKEASSARTVSFGGESARSVLPNACPERRETYDLARNALIAPPASTPPQQGPGTSVTWHRLHRGPLDEWNVNSFAGGAFVTAIRTRTKDELVSYFETHSGAHAILPALDTDVPSR
jgi:lysozyme family protein